MKPKPIPTEKEKPNVTLELEFYKKWSMQERRHAVIIRALVLRGKLSERQLDCQLHLNK